MVDTPVATASAARWLLNSLGSFSWALQAGQQALHHCLGGNYCSCAVCQQIDGERQAAWAGYKCPRPCTGSPSAGAECKTWSSSCQLPSSCSSHSAPCAQGRMNIPLSSLCPMEATRASGIFRNFAAANGFSLKVKFSLFPTISCLCILVSSSPPPRRVFSRIKGFSAGSLHFLCVILWT